MSDGATFAFGGLSNLSALELAVIYDALCIAQDTLNGVYNQPRCTERAGDYIEAEIERLAGLSTQIVRELRSRQPPADTRQREYWARVILDWIVNRCGDSHEELFQAAELVNARAAA